MKRRSPWSFLSRFACTILGLVVSTAGGLAHAQEPEALSPKEIVERASAAVVLIETTNGDTVSQGSGFFVDEAGVIVTCLHVIDGARSVTVSLRDGTRLDDVAVRAFDVEKDLAVLVVDLPADSTRPVSLDLGDTTAIEPGSEIIVIGNPLGLENTVTDGIVSAVRDADEEPADEPGGDQPPKLALPQSRLLQISATISAGSSGGPVLNDRAEVIGVATSGVLWGTAGLNFAVPAGELPALLSQDDAMDLETFGERLADAQRELARPCFLDGRLAYERDEFEKARYHLERALQRFPRYEEALLLSGTLAMEAGEIDVAEERFELATQVNEYSADAWYHLGEVHQSKALATGESVELARAEVAFEKALEIDFRHARAAFGLAVVQYGKGELDRAEKLLTIAIDSDPVFPDAHYALGEIRLRRGQINEARDAFENALWEDEDHAPSHFGMARLYMELERTPPLGAYPPHGRAAQHWEEFLRLSENDPLLAEERDLAILIVKQYFPHLLD
jgi:tetratricopeptide (TPR) repeat protein